MDVYKILVLSTRRLADILAEQPDIEVVTGEPAPAVFATAKTWADIVRDPAIHDAACEKVRACAEQLGLTGLAMIESPIAGAEGNKEFLLYGRR